MRELLDIDISKQQQSSDWGADTLTPAQLDYAASDVLYLHRLRAALDARLAREGRRELAQACFDFLPAAGAARPRRLGRGRHLRPQLSGGMTMRRERAADPEQLIATGRRVIGIEAAALGELAATLGAELRRGGGDACWRRAGG